MDEKTCWAKFISVFLITKFRSSFAVSSRALYSFWLKVTSVSMEKADKQKQSRLDRKNHIQPHKNNRLMVSPL